MGNITAKVVKTPVEFCYETFSSEVKEFKKQQEKKQQERKQNQKEDKKYKKEFPKRLEAESKFRETTYGIKLKM
tara:strand:+ start:94 stop:315 length:222 start_codon:yes stop_codon:yes gene_type:complete